MACIHTYIPVQYMHLFSCPSFHTYICIYIYIYIYIYIHTHTYLHTLPHTHTWHTYIHTYIPIECMQLFPSPSFLFRRSCTYLYVCIYARVHMYSSSVYIDKNICIHTFQGILHIAQNQI